MSWVRTLVLTLLFLLFFILLKILIPIHKVLGPPMPPAPRWTSLPLQVPRWIHPPSTESPSPAPLQALPRILPPYLTGITVVDATAGPSSPSCGKLLPFPTSTVHRRSHMCIASRSAGLQIRRAYQLVWNLCVFIVQIWLETCLLCIAGHQICQWHLKIWQRAKYAVALIVHPARWVALCLALTCARSLKIIW
jgi:hypothetical protein